MDLLYVGAILMFGAITLAMLTGYDKLHRKYHDRGSH